MRKLLTCLTHWKWSLGLAIAVCSLQLFALPAYATGVYQMPQLSPGQDTWIIDNANQISRLNEGKISQQLRQFAQSNGTELRLVTIHRLDYGETPQSFADGLFEKWFATPEAQANQALLVLDDVTNGAALRVGETAAAQLTPEIASSVTQETIQVPLRQGNKYNQAFLEATDRLVAVLAGEADPGPPVDDESFELESTFASAEETEEKRSSYTLIVVGFLIAATVIPMATYWFYQSMGG
ncbi:MAG: YgcG family protein [Leptolyngbyaceae cyanobacterium SM1_1_3]|nr:YgcG family protein [Leptolyngbyaceae cyanobacterium SM1_1_3]NJM85297.1 YgcG family protein [Leptolyngbyaceae cyanobacterium RM2_2_21]NJN01700.1 YgcG family protein [Leptolyngbyaceae cyanobacterium RM1_1_2]NJO11798.1 YgcG family protein [Leptolyngbyaceae cyanobacterium SL_1_1]